MSGRDRGARIITRCRAEPPVWKFRDLIIRRYRTADHEHVLALHHEGLAQVGLRPGDGVYYDHDLPRLEELYLCEGGEFLVGERLAAVGPGSCVVAMVGLRPVDRETAEVVRLRVEPRMQRRGFGGAMLLALEARATELGYRVLRGDTTALQQPALELYRRFGWQETSREVICGIVNIYGEKPLPPLTRP